MTVRLKDVAKKAQISTSIASHILNDNYKIKLNPETRRRVKEVAKKLGYTPNAVARGLRLKKTETIGLLIPNVMTSFYNEIIRGIEMTANEENYVVLVGCSAFNTDKEKMYLASMLNRGVDGILISSFKGSNIELLKKINNEVPLVFVDSFIEGVVADYVVTDNLKGAYIGTKELIRAGATKICYVGHVGVSVLQDRFNGFVKALNDYKIEFSKDLFMLDCEEYLLGKLISQKKIDSIFISADYIMPLLRVLRKYNLAIPADIKVATFDEPFFNTETQEDIDVLKIVKEPMPYIQQPKLEMGKKACEILIEKIKTGIYKHTISKILMEPKLKI
ncbi:MAG: LacI family DNA-binding transcriptional regulator [Candidatus Firestonebacteria bacterium]